MTLDGAAGRMRIVVCDAGLGNLANVARAVRHAAGEGARVEVSSDPEAVRAADLTVFPGQGAFRDCARALSRGLGEALVEHIRRGAPYVGICLGLQVLFEESEEDPGARGLAVVPGRVVRLSPGLDALGRREPLPHVGWNVAARAPSSTHPAATCFDTPRHYYFVHSYAAAPADATLVSATTTYGAPFCAAIARDNVVAFQFHPEKSQRAGLDLLARTFARLR